MTIARTTLAALLAALGLTMTANTAQAEDINWLTRVLEEDTRELVDELRIRFRHTAEYPHMNSDAVQLYQRAVQVRQVARFRGSWLHLRSDVAEMDRLYHHLEQLICVVEAHAAHGHGGHPHGHVRHVKLLLEDIELSLHELRAELARIVPPPCPGHGPVMVPAPAPVPAPGVWHGGHGGRHAAPGHGGVNIGSGPIRFQIRF